MKRTHKYEAFLTDQDRRRHERETEKGQIIRFRVQYEAKISDKWYTIVGYDNYHGYVHVDIYHPNQKKEQKELTFGNLKETLSWCEKDIKQNWPRHRVRYERELEDEQAKERKI